MSALSSPSLVLVGCGHMGSALLQGLLKTPDVFQSITIVEPQTLSLPQDVRHVHRAEQLPEEQKIDCILFAIKPQLFAETLPQYRRFMTQNPLVISIAAGKTLHEMSVLLSYKGAMVRAMPNMPVAVGRGVIAAASNGALNETQEKLCQSLFKTVGSMAMVREEKYMDAVTAVSGSGPAYLFLFLEALQQAAISVGLPADFAKYLAVETVAGSLAMVQETGSPMATLRQQVTSPNGTTAAALTALMREEGGLIALVQEAVQAAHKRATELAGFTS
jgi:pyrroline-5-carboxylate reductase